MKGHEYARQVVRDHLKTTVPTRLAAIKTALAATTPSAPASYILADRLPTDPALYPCVLINSSGSPRIRSQSVYADGDAADFICVYDLRLVVACRTDTAGGDEEASVDRDRLLLAVREALLTRASLPDDIEIVTTDMREDTGAATQDLRGRPLAAGQITFGVGTLETLAAIPAPASVEETAIALTGNPSGTPDITPN